MGKITRGDRIVIKALRVEKNWSSRRFLEEFASKAWCKSSLDRLIKTIDAGLFAGVQHNFPSCLSATVVLIVRGAI